MSQNSSTNKISSFIGFTLLILIIAFTVFINFSVEEPNKEVKETEILEIEEPNFRELDSSDLANLWKLEKLQTDSITISQNGKYTYVKINKNIGTTTYNPLNDANFNKLDDSLKKYVQEVYNDYSGGTVYINYGTLIFDNANYNGSNEKLIFEDVEISNLNHLYADTSKLIEIAGLFIDYQIQSINTESIYGNFTHIFLKDGREIFLVKKETDITEDYKYLLEDAEYLNDSTRIIYPYSY